MPISLADYEKKLPKAVVSLDDFLKQKSAPDLSAAPAHTVKPFVDPAKVSPSSPEFKNLPIGHAPAPHFDESGVNETIVASARGMAAVPEALIHGGQQIYRGVKALPDLVEGLGALSPDIRMPQSVRQKFAEKFESGAAGAADVALGGITVGMQALPGMAAGSTIAGVVTPLAGEIGVKAGRLAKEAGAARVGATPTEEQLAAAGQTGRRLGEFAGGVTGFGVGDLMRNIKPTVSLAIAFAATEGGAEGVSHLLNSPEYADMKPETKERWIQVAGHGGFLAGMGLSHVVLGAARRLTSNEYADERARMADATILTENGIDPASIEKRALRRADAQVTTWKREQEKKRAEEEKVKAANEEVRQKELFNKRIIEQQNQEKAEAARQVELEQIQARQEAKQKTLDKKFAPRSRMAGDDNKPRKPILKTAAGTNPDYQAMREDLLAVGVPEHEVVRMTPLEVDARWMKFAGETAPEPVEKPVAQGTEFKDLPKLDTETGKPAEVTPVRALAEKIARGEKTFTLEELQTQKNSGAELEAELKTLRAKPVTAKPAEQPPGKGYDSDFSSLNNIPKPLGSYLGGKAGLLQRGHANGIVPQGLIGYDEFHEPFVGGGVWGNAFTDGNKTIQRHVNDLDPDVVNFHKTVKDNPTAVANELMRFENEARDLSERDYTGGEEARKAANEWWNGKRSAHRWNPKATAEEKAAYDKTTPEQKAAWMAFQNSGNGVWGENQGLVNEKGEWKIKPGTIGRTIGQVNAHSRGLKNTTVYNEDARVALGRAEKAAKSGKKVFAAVDPPYLNTKGYRVGGDLSTDPKAAAAFIDNEVASAVKSGVDVVYTNAPEPEILDALKRIPGMHTQIISIASQTKGGARGERQEVIAWTGTGRPTGIAGREGNPGRGVRQADGSGGEVVSDRARPGKVDSGNGTPKEVPDASVGKRDVEPTAGTNPPGSSATAKPQTGRPEASPPSTPRGKYEHGLRTEFKLNEEEIAHHMALTDAAAGAYERTSEGKFTAEDWYKKNRIVGEADATPEGRVLNQKSAPAYKLTAEDLLKLPETKRRVDGIAGEEESARIIDEWHAKTENYKPGVFYHATGSKGVGGGDAGIGGVGYGLYLGKDSGALERMYNLDGGGMDTYHGEPKFLDLADYDRYRDFEKEAIRKFGKLKYADHMRKLALQRGFDGIRYYDPETTGEEFVLYKTDKVKKSEGGKLYQEGKPAPEWYSGVQRAIEQKMPEKASAEQILAIIRDAKKEEVEELGIKDWLKDNPKPTKKEVLDFIEMNKVELEEVILREDAPDLTPEREKEKQARLDEVEDKADEMFAEFINGKIDKHQDYYETPSFNPEARQHENGKWEAYVNDEVADHKWYKTEKEAFAAAEKEADRMQDDQWSELRNDYSSEYSDVRDKYVDELTREIESEFEDESGAGQTQYSKPSQGLTTPGHVEGSNFELLLKLKMKPKQIDTKGWTAERRPETHSEAWVVTDADGNTVEARGRNIFYGADEAGAIKNAIDIKGARDGYTAPHFGGQGDDLVAHFRGNKRTVPIENVKASHPGLYERLKAAGRTEARVLMVEEMQSDIHQKARSIREKEIKRVAEEKGLTEKEVKAQKLVPEDFGYKKKDSNRLSDEERAEYHAIGAKIAQGGSITDAERSRFRDFNERQLRDERGGGGGGVPDFPLKKVWNEALVKKILRYAAENEYDLAAWSPGEMQVKRYAEALQSKVDEIQWEKTKDGVQIKGYKLDGDMQGTRREMAEQGIANLEKAVEKLLDGRTEGELEWQEKGKLADLRDTLEKQKAYARGKEVVNTHQREDELSDAIGKAMADKILSDPNPSGVIRGKDITVSSTGMAGFYDTLVPSFVDKYTKKFGGKTGQTNIGGGVAEVRADGKDFPLDPRKRGILFDHYEMRGRTIYGVHENGESVPVQTFSAVLKSLNEQGADIGTQHGLIKGLVDDYNKRLAVYKGGDTQLAHSLEITPDLRKSVLQGQALFQGNGVKRGSIEFLKNGDRLIRAMKNPDLSTAHEEITHSQIGLWAEMAESGIEQAKKDLRVMERHTGLPENSFGKLHRGFVDGTLNTAQTKLYRNAQEKLVSLNRKYMQDGSAPTPELRGVFERFKQWLTDIYGQIRETVHPELKEVFDRMLGGGEKVAEGMKASETKAEAAKTGIVDESSTSIKNAQTMAERAERGWGEIDIPDEQRKTFEGMKEAGRKAVESGRVDPRAFAKKLMDNPKPVTAEQEAVLLYDRMRLRNEHRQTMKDINFADSNGNESAAAEGRERLAEIEEHININEHATKYIGTAGAQSMGFRRAIVKDDYSLDHLIQRAKIANNGKAIKPEVRAKLEDLSKQLEFAIQKYDGHESEIQKLGGRKAELFQEIEDGGGLKVTVTDHQSGESDSPDIKLEYRDGVAFVNRDNVGGEDFLTLSSIEVGRKNAGTGSAFLSKIEDYAKQEGLKTIRLQPENENAQRFFAKNGYREADGVMEKSLLNSKGKTKVVRYSAEGMESTDSFRGGTWYSTPESKTYDFSKGERGIGGQKKTESEIDIKNPLTIKDASVQDGSFAVINNGHEDAIPKKYAAIAENLWKKLNAGEVKNPNVHIETALRKAGIPEKQVRAVLKSANKADAAMDLIVGKGLAESGYDALILENERGGKVTDRHVFKVAGGDRKAELFQVGDGDTETARIIEPILKKYSSMFDKEFDADKSQKKVWDRLEGKEFDDTVDASERIAVDEAARHYLETRASEILPVAEAGIQSQVKEGHEIVFRTARDAKEGMDILNASEQGNVGMGFAPSTHHVRDLVAKRVAASVKRGETPIYVSNIPSVSAFYKKWNARMPLMFAMEIPSDAVKYRSGKSETSSGVANAAVYPDTELIIDGKRVARIWVVPSELSDKLAAWSTELNNSQTRNTGFRNAFRDADPELARRGVEALKDLREPPKTLGRPFVESPVSVSGLQVKRGDRVVLATGDVVKVVDYRPIEPQHRQYVEVNGQNARLGVSGYKGARIPGLMDANNMPDVMVVRKLSPGERFGEKDRAKVISDNAAMLSSVLDAALKTNTKYLAEANKDGDKDRVGRLSERGKIIEQLIEKYSTPKAELFQEAVDDPKRLAAYKNRMRKKSAELLGKLVTKNFKKREKLPPVKLDTEAIRLRDNVESLKKRIDITMKQVEFTNMTPLQRAGRYLGKYRYINMLSAPLTHIVNTASNVGQAVGLAPATKLVTGGIDAIASRMTGKERRAYVSDVPAYYRGLINSIGEATTNAVNVFKGKGSFDRPDVTYLPKSTDEPNKLLKPLAKFNDAFEGFLNALEASDAFFSTMVRSGERESIANEYAKNNKEIDLKKIDEAAGQRAKYWVFRKDLDPKNKTGQGDALAYIDKMTNGVYQLRRVPGVSWIIPFVKTPANILKQGLEFSPAGIVTMKGAENKPEQLAKAMIGSTVFAGAAWLAQVGGSTWSPPTGDKQKREFYGSGKQPYSLKIGDKWVSYSRLGTLAYPVALAAAIKYYTEQNPKADDKTLDKIANVLSGQAKFFSDQSYMQGLGDLIKASEGDQRIWRSLVQSTGGQLVPLKSLQSWTARLLDPVYRNPATTVESFKSGVPFLSKTVPAYMNSGSESERDMPYLNAVSPVQMRTDKSGTPPYRKESSGRGALIQRPVSPLKPLPPTRRVPM